VKYSALLYGYRDLMIAKTGHQHTTAFYPLENKSVSDQLVCFFPETLHLKSSSGKVGEIDMDCYVFFKDFVSGFNIVGTLAELLVLEHEQVQYAGILFIRVAAYNNEAGKYMGVTNQFGTLQYLYHIKHSVRYRYV
jgi:hypothetical protein